MAVEWFALYPKYRFCTDKIARLPAIFLYLTDPTQNNQIMKTLNPADGLWIMVEEPIEAPTENTQPTENESFHDSYEYFPDFGI